MTDEITALQGTWRVTALEMNGVAFPPEQIGESSIEIKAAHFAATSPDSKFEGELTLDARARPKRFAVAIVRGAERRTVNAIYEVEGDALQICFNVKGGPAPTAFATKPGDNCAFQKLVRERWRVG